MCVIFRVCPIRIAYICIREVGCRIQIRPYGTFDTLVIDEEIKGGYSRYTVHFEDIVVLIQDKTCNAGYYPVRTGKPQQLEVSYLWHTACEFCNTLGSDRSSSS